MNSAEAQCLSSGDFVRDTTNGRNGIVLAASDNFFTVAWSPCGQNRYFIHHSNCQEQFEHFRYLGNGGPRESFSDRLSKLKERLKTDDLAGALDSTHDADTPEFAFASAVDQLTQAVAELMDRPRVLRGSKLVEQSVYGYPLPDVLRLLSLGSPAQTIELHRLASLVVAVIDPRPLPPEARRLLDEIKRCVRGGDEPR